QLRLRTGATARAGGGQGMIPSRFVPPQKRGVTAQTEVAMRRDPSFPRGSYGWTGLSRRRGRAGGEPPSTEAVEALEVRRLLADIVFNGTQGPDPIVVTADGSNLVV